MPIKLEIEGAIWHSVLYGRLTDDELLAYYQRPEFEAPRERWLELVDGSDLAEMAVTSAGQRRLAEFASLQTDRLRGGAVAMVAKSDLAYGMFRMWQMRREGLGYAVEVFRELEPARKWLLARVPAPSH